VDQRGFAVCDGVADNGVLVCHAYPERNEWRDYTVNLAAVLWSLIRLHLPMKNDEKPVQSFVFFGDDEINDCL